jgi:cytochrome P450
MASRVFLGDELCRNEAWLKITKEYAINMFGAIRKFQHYPPPLRKIFQWFIPECKLVRDQFETASQIIAPVIAERRRVKEEARVTGKEIPVFNDALDWVTQEAEAKGCEFDMRTFQLMISFVAIHTSADLLVQTMLDLAQHQEIMQPLRDEIVGVLRADGWRKTSLYNMKLLDSVLKESQRLRPIGYGT